MTSPAPSGLRLPGIVRHFAVDLGAACRAALRDRWLVGYALLFLPTALALAWFTGDPTWITYYLLTVGVGSLVLAFLTYRGTHDPAAQAQAAAGRGPIRHPAAETGLILVVIAAFVLARTDQLLHGPFTTWLFSLRPDKDWPDQSMIAVKFVLNVLLPLGLFRALGYSFRELGLRWGAGWRLWPVFLLIGGPKVLAALGQAAGPGAGLVGLAESALWFFLAAGLPEELTSRVLLLPRLEAWSGSAHVALWGQAVIFALTHVPIRFMEFQNPLFIAANLFLFVLALGLLFGYIYQRTAALFPVAWVHALVDAG